MELDYILETDNLFKSYTKLQTTTPVLKGIHLKVKRGDFVALMGPSGVGKSTLLHLLGMLDTADSGNITLQVDGKTIKYNQLSETETAKIRNKHIGFVFQFHHLLPEFTSLENIMLPALIAGESYSQATEKAINLINIIGLNERKDFLPTELSGGEQQRIAIARAMMNNPDIIFADEPTGNLDKANSEMVLELINDLRKNYNITFIVATHSNSVATIAETIINMSDGKILY